MVKSRKNNVDIVSCKAKDAKLRVVNSSTECQHITHLKHVKCANNWLNPAMLYNGRLYAQCFQRVNLSPSSEIQT